MKQQDNPSTPLLYLAPRVIRAKDAPRYLGMSRDVFAQDVKPYVTVIPIGKQGIGFDRLELDAWLEHYKHRNGRSAEQTLIGGTLWDANEPQGLRSAAVSGTSTSASKDMAAFVKALEQATLSKRKTT